MSLLARGGYICRRLFHRHVFHEKQPGSFRKAPLFLKFCAASSEEKNGGCAQVIRRPFFYEGMVAAVLFCSSRL